MSTLQTFVACEPIQRSIAQMFFGQTNRKPQSDLNITRFLLSGANTNGVMKQEIAPNGKLRTIRVVYGQRWAPGESEEGAIIGCEDGVINGDTSKDYILDPSVGRSKSLVISPELMRQRCESDPEYMAREVRGLMDLVLSDSEQDYANKIALNLGNFATDVDNGDAPGTTTEKTVFARSSTGVLLTDAYATISYDGIANQNGRPLVFGSQPWWDFARLIGAGCCNEQGIDAGLYATQNPYLFAYSREAAVALGEPNAAFALAPGSVQLLSGNEFENPLLRINDGALVMGTLMYPDPAIPVMFDYKVKLDDCAKNFVVTVALNSDLAFMPDDMFKATDRLYGVNGLTKYIIEDCYVPCGVQP